MRGSAQKQRLDTPWLHSEAFLSCCLKSGESLLALHIFTWSHGKEKVVISFLSPVWDKDHTKCKSSHSTSYVLTQALHTEEKVCPCYTAQGDWQNTNKTHLLSFMPQIQTQGRWEGRPSQHQGSTGPQAGRAGLGSTGPSPSMQMPSWVGRAAAGAGALGAIGNTDQARDWWAAGTEQGSDLEGKGVKASLF